MDDGLCLCTASEMPTIFGGDEMSDSRCIFTEMEGNGVDDLSEQIATVKEVSIIMPKFRHAEK